MLFAIVSKAINQEHEVKYIRGLLLIRLHCCIGVMAGDAADPERIEGQQTITERPVVAGHRSHDLLAVSQ